MSLLVFVVDLNPASMPRIAVIACSVPRLGLAVEGEPKSSQPHVTQFALPGVLTYSSTLEPSVCGTRVIHSNGNPIAIFKPQDEEGVDEKGKPRKRGVALGSAAKKEVAAYLLDRGHAGVPETSIVALQLTADGKVKLHAEGDTCANHTPELKFGSIQRFVPHECCSEDLGSQVFDQEEVHRIGILDIRLLNLDRHTGNLLVQRHSGKPHLVPIDHGYSLPSFRDTSDVYFCWSSWKQAKAPFSPSMLKHIASLDPLEDMRMLLQLGIDKDEAMSSLLATVVLQRAASRGLCLAQIAGLVQRDDPDVPSVMETSIQTALAAVVVQGAEDDSYDCMSFLKGFVHAMDREIERVASSSSAE